jgi:hypothetical protein
VIVVDTRIKRQILERRIAGLRGHIEHVSGGVASPNFVRELSRAEAELEQQQDTQPPRG